MRKPSRISKRRGNTPPTDGVRNSGKEFQTAVRQTIADARAAAQKVSEAVAANRTAHAQMVKVLTNEGGAITVERNGAVKVDLRGVAGAVKEQLDNAGLTIVDKVPLEKVSGSITIFQSEDLYKARRGAQQVFIERSASPARSHKVAALIAG